MNNSQEYTTEAKQYWLDNSDKMGNELTWEVFCKIWMAAINSSDIEKIDNP